MESVRERNCRPSEESFRKFLETHAEFQKIKDVKEMRSKTIQRLRHQAMPAQIQLLQQYGQDNTSLLNVRENATETLAKTSVSSLKGLMEVAHIDAHGCLEKSDLIAKLVDSVGMDSLCALWASQKCVAPKCVCHSSLRRVDGVERFRSMLDNTEAISDEELEHRLRQIHISGGSIVVCDICEESVPLLSKRSYVWTCENHSSTILHATSYDVCDKCFAQRTCTESHGACMETAA